MSSPQEQEKLTPDSPNSYDGSRTPMAEENKDIEFSEESDPEESAEQTNEDDSDEKDRRMKEKEQLSAFKQFLWMLISPTRQEYTEEQKDAIGAAFVKFASSDELPPSKAGEAKEKTQQQKHDLAMLLLGFYKPDQLHSHSSDTKEVEATAVMHIFEGLLDASKEAGFDTEELTDELAQLAEQESPQEQQMDREEKLDEFFEYKLENSTLDALKELHKDLTELRKLFDGQPAMEQEFNDAEKALKEIIERNEFETMFADIIVRVSEQLAEASLENAAKAEEERKINEEEEARTFMSIFLTPNASPEAKRKLTATMLADHFSTDIEKVGGIVAKNNMEKRERLLQLAEKMGLKKEEILAEEAFVDIEFSQEPEAVNEFESVEALSAFEQMVSEQIEQASPEEVEAIQNTWIVLRDKIDGREDLSAEQRKTIREQANEAIEVLDAIKELKVKIIEARLNGTRLNPEDVPLPLFLRNELTKKKKDEEAEKAKVELVKLLSSLFMSARVFEIDKESIADKAILTTITDLILASKHSQSDKEQLLSRLAACFPATSNPEDEDVSIAGLRGFLGEYAWLKGLAGPEFPDEVSAQSADPQFALEAILQDALSTISEEDLAVMKQVWKDLLADNKDLSPTIQMEIEQVRDFLKTILKKPTFDTSRRLVERPETAKTKEVEIERIEELQDTAEAQERFVKAMRELTSEITADSTFAEGEAETIELLLTVIASPNSMTADDKKRFVAEKRIAELVEVFAETPQGIKLRRRLAALSWELGLDPDVLEKERKSVKETIREQTVNPLEKVEELVRASMARVSKKDVKELQKQFVKFLDKTDKDSIAYVQAKEAMRLLGNMDHVEAVVSEDRLQEEKQSISDSELRNFERANNIIASMVKDTDMNTYLSTLLKNIQGGMSASELEDQLVELNRRAKEITDNIRSEISNEDTTNHMKDKVALVIYFETSLDDYRKYLIREINKGKTPSEDGVAEVLVGKINELKAEANAITGDEDNRPLTDERFQSFIDNLEEALRHPWMLKHAELKSAYEALLTQDAVVRTQLMDAGKLKECAERTQKVHEVQMELYRQIVLAENKTNTFYDEETVRQLEESASQKAEAHALQSGIAYYKEATGNAAGGGSNPPDGWTPVPVEGRDEYGRSQGTDYYRPRGNNPAFELQQAARTAERSITAHAAREGRRQSAAEQYAMENIVEGIQSEEFQYIPEQEIQSRTVRLDNMVNKLHQLISEGLQNSQGQMVKLDRIPGVMELQTAIARERDALAKLRGYRGFIMQPVSEMDPALFDGDVHEVLGERIRRLRVALNDEQASVEGESYEDDELRKYYKELQRWVNILLSNDVRKKPDDAHRPDVLRLSTDRYERYKNIATTNFDSIKNNREAVLQNLTYMLDSAQGDFLRYFMQNAPDPKDARGPSKLLGVTYQRPEDMGPYSPESLGATMEKLAEEYGAEYKTGGKRELIDAEGKFMINNFYYWVRQKINQDVDYNKEGNIEPYQKLIIKLDMGQISMYELLLLIPEYTSQRQFEIRQTKDGKTYSGWGEKKESPEFNYDMRSTIAAELEFRQMTHQLRVQYVNTINSGGKDGYLNIQKQLHQNNHWTRANNLFLWFGIPSCVTNGTQEIEAWLDPLREQQGSLGKAMSDMLVMTYYLSEMTKYYETWDRDEHGHAKKKKNKKTGKWEEQKREKYFNENMFYRFLEPNGANRYLIKMAEGALAVNNDAKRVYADFIRRRIQAAANEYKRQVRTDKERELIQQFADEHKPNKDDLGIDINFTENKQFAQFFTLVEREIKGNTSTNDAFDQDIAAKVRKSILENLRDDYFRPLKKVKVANLSNRQGSNRFLLPDLKNPTIEFGQIKVSGYGTMSDLLDSFEIDQINVFDYSNDPNDPRNPFKQYYGNEKRLREEIDKFMADPNGRNHKLFRRNERMMLEFAKHMARLDRGDLNHYRDATENVYARNMNRRATKYIMEKLYGIDSQESEYVWWWSRDYILLWGIATTLDVDGIGFRWDGRLINTGNWRPRREGKDAGGNHATFDEFLALSMPFPMAIRVSNLSNPDETWGSQTPFYWMQGGEGGYVKPRAIREFDKRSNYEFDENAEQQFAGNNLENASELIELLVKTEFDFTGIIKFNMYGNVEFDYAKARELFGKWRKAIRYTYGKNNIDYRTKIWSKGRERTMYEHFLGPKTRALNELLQRRTKNRKLDFIFKDPSDAVMMSVVAAEIYDHREMFTQAHHWSIQNVQELERFLLRFLTEWKKEEDSHGHEHSHPNEQTLYHTDVFKAALKAYKTSYSKMYATEFTSSFFGGLFGGFGQALKAFVKGGKWVY